MSLLMFGTDVLQRLIMNFEPGLDFEMDYGSSCLYIYNVPGDVHQFVLVEIITTLGSAMKRSGIPKGHARLIF